VALAEIPFPRASASINGSEQQAPELLHLRAGDLTCGEPAQRQTHRRRTTWVDDGLDLGLDLGLDHV